VKRFFGVVGSPRREGNTHILVKTILQGARSRGAEFELVHLADFNIQDCDGCHACWEGRHCSKPDDMPPLYTKVSLADVIVFGTPVYWYGPTALMKAFLDRFVYFNCPENRPKIKGKQAILATPYEEKSDQTAAPLVAMFEKSFRYLEMEFAGKILVPGVGERKDILKKEDALEQAHGLGAWLAED